MDRLRRFVTVVALVAPLALAAPAMASDASLSGTVTDPHGAPVSGVAITATRSTAPYPIYGATTDANGHYTISIADSGMFLVDFIPPAGSHLGEIVYNGHTAGGYAVDYVTLPVGASVTGIDAQLPASGAITGTVTDQLGTPVAGTIVTARANPSTRSLGTATTDASGHYTLDLATGVYDVEFVPPAVTGLGEMLYNDHPRVASGLILFDLVSVTAPSVTSGIDAHLLPVGQVPVQPIPTPITPVTSPYTDPLANGNPNSDPYRDPVSDLEPRGHPSLGNRRLHVSTVDGAIATLACGRLSDCLGSAVLRTSHGGRLGGTTFHVVAGHERQIRIPLSHTARRSLARHHGRLTARLQVSGTEILGRTWTVTIVHRQR
jgi:Carboxypeptidase regulatory-like domain